MNNLFLSNIFWATLNVLYLPAADGAPASHEKVMDAHESQVVQLQSEAVETHSAGDNTMHAPDAPTPPSLPPISLPTSLHNAPRAALTPPTPPIPLTLDIDAIVSASLSQAFAGSPTLLGDRATKNAPYRAEVISERVQILADGNQIVKRTSQMSYRDSAGRTRTELNDANGALMSVRIFDAISGASYNVSPLTKSATKLTMDLNFQKSMQGMAENAKTAAKAAVINAQVAAAEAARAVGQVRDGVANDAKELAIEGGKPGEQVTIHRTEVHNIGSRGGVAEDIQIRVLRTDGTEPMSVKSGASYMTFTGKQASIAIGGAHDNARGSADSVLSSAIGSSFQDRVWSAKSTTKELGFRDFSGVRAEGKLRSYTIPAGEIGNKNAITVSTETWISPELQITIYSKHSDPRTGENIYRLANISRNEQSMTLFAVPDGYTVKTIEMPAFSVKRK